MKKKIGIITWFKYENYGTKLQALALQAYLKQIGYKVELIDFRIPEVHSILKKKSFFQFTQKIVNWLVTRLAKYLYREKLLLRSQRMKNVIKEYCTISDYAEDDATYIAICNQYDILICGSDQIWNPNWYHPYYYADFPEIRPKKISYAPSIGIQDIPDSLKALMKKSLKSFSYITVREERAAQLLEPLIGYFPEKVIDPTMLLSGQQWIELLGIDNKSSYNGKKNDNNEFQYVLCYFLSDNRKYWNAAKKFAKMHNLPIKIIPQGGLSFFEKGDICAEAGVKEFLEFILNATYVLTDSFHGTIFSLLMEKEVYIFERFQEDNYFSQNSRIKELVKQFGIEEHFLPYGTSSITEKEYIDYTNIKKHLYLLQTNSNEILLNAIKSF